jgi:co-chaperonin GroES (HSP10)
VIQPTGNRVLIKPDPRPEATASGLVIPDNAFHGFDMSGIVVTVGQGPASAQRQRVALLKHFKMLVSNSQGPPSTTTWLHARIDAMAAQTVSDLRVGDHVAFPYTAGTVIEVDGERHLLLQEDQIVAILGREDTAA